MIEMTDCKLWLFKNIAKRYAGARRFETKRHLDAPTYHTVAYDDRGWFVGNYLHKEKAGVVYPRSLHKAY